MQMNYELGHIGFTNLFKNKIQNMNHWDGLFFGNSRTGKEVIDISCSVYKLSSERKAVLSNGF